MTRPGPGAGRLDPVSSYPAQCQCRTCVKAPGCTGKNRRVRSCIRYEAKKVKP